MLLSSLAFEMKWLRNSWMLLLAMIITVVGVYLQYCVRCAAVSNHIA